jgi:hypothetical protein
MQAAQKRGSGVNLGFLAPLTPFRHYVMGEESMDRAATASETHKSRHYSKRQVQQVRLAFTTTAIPQHIGYKGRRSPVAKPAVMN